MEQVDVRNILASLARANELRNRDDDKAFCAEVARRIEDEAKTLCLVSIAASLEEIVAGLAGLANHGEGIAGSLGMIEARYSPNR